MQILNGNSFRDAVISGANNITNNRKAVDELNVFPVPDGDTGTNMSMTINNAVKELKLCNDKTVSEIADITASSLLRGARGNSGVILSLLFRGFAKGLKGKAELDAEALSKALELGVAAAYKAVMKPTEGTILTVARLASEAVKASYESGADLLTAFGVLISAGNEALAQTPEMLPVLKKAGVVDAGGKGFMTIMEGMYSVVKDGNMVLPADAESSSEGTTEAKGSSYDAEITYTYCTEYIVNKQSTDSDPRALRAYLETIGDSVVVVDDKDIIKVHVHTDHPGKALEKGLTFGALTNMKIENMRDQHESVKHSSAEAGEAVEETDNAPVAIEKRYGFVAVAAGEGLENLFCELGADIVVSGGQTMNPSTDDILKAVERTPAEYVFVLPNNKNIIMAAEQAVALSTRKVIVIPSRTIPQGISAMLSFDADTDQDTNATEMVAACGRVSSGSVTFAARDSSFDGHNIKEGELLALNNGKISFVEKPDALSKCVVKLTKQLCTKSTSFVTLIYGCDIDEEAAEAVAAELIAKLSPDIEVNLIKGDQPVYYFLISVE